MNRVLTFLVVMFFLGLTGCAGRYNVGGSYVGQLPKGGTSAIAEDATAHLSTLYPPGRTSIRLVAPNKQTDEFTQKLETSLRQKGFTLSPSGTVTMSYVLDELRSAKPPVWYLQLRIADKTQSKTIARSYTDNGQPVAGFSSLSTGGESND